MKSLPIIDEARLRILSFIDKFGIEMVAFTEFVVLSNISTIPFSKYKSLCEVLETNMTAVDELKLSSGLQEVFKLEVAPPVKKGIIISKKN